LAPLHGRAEGSIIKFSLINVVEQSSPLVSGSWIQDHIGTLDSAREVVRATEAANSNKIDVAVVAAVSSPRAILFYWSDVPRLDIA
jgi:hypothetical protein